MTAPQQVVLSNVPAALFIESQNHQQDLVRELALIDIGDRYHPHDEPLPRKIASLISAIFDEFGDVRTATRQQALDALARGEESLTLTVPVKEGMVAALERWLEVVEEADRLCEEGVLLTLASRPEVCSLRRWYVEAITRAVSQGNTHPVPYETTNDTAISNDGA